MPTNTKPVITNLGAEEAAAIVQEWHDHPDTITTPSGCWIAKRTSADYKKIHCQELNGNVSQYQLHVIAWAAANNKDPPTGMDISHLCHENYCFFSGHLVAESSTLNNRRKRCYGSRYCPLHKNIVVHLCDHNPRCVISKATDKCSCHVI
ncbi:zinc-binding loop region of homing endonuclease-domain-containing protein [Cercophora samala]|uniref:Zinc-binding loop region of homing endonuclease-domain-containing protein n=1 Tax=Cercophora samala TaxID=330535 RepID=A0AA39ZC33_9PEZI|nr:zinc-binding loop region of homing endonuclease-domain-containing protein [Cercophora samala]